MIPRIPILQEVTYSEYKENVGKEVANYVRYILSPTDIKDPEEIADFALKNLNNFNNTDVNKYYKMIGIIANEAQEEEEKRLGGLSIAN